MPMAMDSVEKIAELLYNLIRVASGIETAEEVHRVSNDTKSAFISILKRREFPKGYVLSVPGKPTDELYIIEKGLLQNRSGH